VTDARAALALYRISEHEWENYVKQKNYTNVKKIVKEDANKRASFFGESSESNNNEKKSIFKFN
jgi:hypothetical protein